jgi:hypothetical protein
MEKSKDKKEILIDNKVFTKDEILSLARLFIRCSDVILARSREITRKELIAEGWDESRINEKDDKGYSKLEFTAADNVHYSLTFDDLSDVNDILENKKITEFNFLFWERALKSRFSVTIKQTDADSVSVPGYAEVEGEDRIWAEETLKIVDEFLSSCKNQTNQLKKYALIIIPLTILILNLFLNNVIELISSRMHFLHKLVMTSITSDWLFVGIVITLFTALPVISVYRRLIKLWPRVEIRTGKNYEKIDNERRNKILIIVSIVIIPALISCLMRVL